MKKKYISSIIIASVLIFTSCIKDLDTVPLNEQDFTSDIAYGTSESSYLSGLAKIYYNFANN